MKRSHVAVATIIPFIDAGLDSIHCCYIDWYTLINAIAGLQIILFFNSHISEEKQK